MGAVGAYFHCEPDIVVDDQPGVVKAAEAQQFGRLGAPQLDRRMLVAILDQADATGQRRLDQRGKARQQMVLRRDGIQAAQRRAKVSHRRTPPGVPRTTGPAGIAPCPA